MPEDTTPTAATLLDPLQQRAEECQDNVASRITVTTMSMPGLGH